MAPTAHIFELSFAATLAQFNTMCSTTLPAAGYKVIQAPTKFTGIVKTGMVQFVGNLTADSNVITGITSTAALALGMLVTDPPNDFIQSGSVITAITTNTITLSLPITDDSAGEPIIAFPVTSFQCDFTYDGVGVVNFFGANPVPPSDSTFAGVVSNMLSPTFVTSLTSILAGTLGAPLVKGGQKTQLIFNCTPAQYASVFTTLASADFEHLPMTNYSGVIGMFSATPVVGQIDYAYDGQYFIRFFGANPSPVSEQVQPGVPENNMTAWLISALTTTLAATLGAPVPPNLAVPPTFVP